MQLDRPARGGDPRRRLRGLLIWSGLTLLAALALAMVIASLALELGSKPAPLPTSPTQFSLPGAHPVPVGLAGPWPARQRPGRDALGEGTA